MFWNIVNNNKTSRNVQYKSTASWVEFPRLLKNRDIRNRKLVNSFNLYVKKFVDEIVKKIETL